MKLKTFLRLVTCCYEVIIYNLERIWRCMKEWERQARKYKGKRELLLLAGLLVTSLFDLQNIASTRRTHVFSL